MSSPEQHIGPENTAEKPAVSPEHYERIEKGAENKEVAVESAEKKVERAKVEALEAAISVEKSGAEKHRQPATKAPARRRGAISKHEKKTAFDKHMKQVQAEMTQSQRVFSKFIHNSTVEKVSETIGSTVARPNAILAGSIAAFVLVLSVYVIAKTFGYVLSGFETIAAFIIGWVLGTLYDYFKIMVTGKKG